MLRYLMVLIAPSLLSADFANLAQDVSFLEKAGANWIHIDCFDGHFVPNLTVGPAVIKAIRPHTTLPLDVHYMAKNPEIYIEQTAKAGATRMTFHFEASKNSQNLIKNIQKAGMKAGIAILPKTPVEEIKHLLPLLDQVLVMTVRGGFGGDPFQPAMLAKIAQLKAWREEKTTPPFLIAVDGGISTDTAPSTINAGADVLCAGSSIFKTTNYKKNIDALRK